MRTFVQQSTGKTISAHVGRALARSGVPSLADHFYSVQELPALVLHLKACDPAGFFDLQSLEVDGVRRFHSLTIVFSWWIASGQHLRDVLSIDGTALHTTIGGTLIAAVSLTGNNNITPLGLLFTSMESADMVAPFMHHLRRLYPVQQFIISDSGRAFEAAADAAGFFCHGGCSWHVRDKNTRTKVCFVCCVSQLFT
jgi:hypothetical protein